MVVVDFLKDEDNTDVLVHGLHIRLLVDRLSSPKRAVNSQHNNNAQENKQRSSLEEEVLPEVVQDDADNLLRALLLDPYED